MQQSQWKMKPSELVMEVKEQLGMATRIRWSMAAV